MVTMLDGGAPTSWTAQEPAGAVAIIIPSYQSAPTVTAALRSILAQESNLGDLHSVHLVDDGSRDGTIDAARSLWTSDVPLVTYERHLNYGECATVNYLVESLPSDITWFLILHADDEAKPQWLGTILAELRDASPTVGSICTSYDYRDEAMATKAGENRGVKAKSYIAGDARSVTGTLLQGCWWHISGCAIRRSTFLDVGGLPKLMQQASDWDFLLRLLSAGWGVTYIPTNPFVYRASADSVSSRTFRRHADLLESIEVIQRFKRYLTPRQLFSLHCKYGRMAARRAGRSIVAGDWLRLFWTAPTLLSIAASLGTCLMSSLGPESESLEVSQAGAKPID